MRGARLFVLTVFVVLGLSFMATTAVLAWEYRDHGWLDLAAMDSHLFVFFPTLGILALVAFFVPSSVLVDLYWHGNVPFGRLRFSIGTVVVALVAFGVAQLILSARSRSMWEIAPVVLSADKGEGCGARDAICQRMPMRAALANLRRASQGRYGLQGLAHDCRQETGDPLVEAAKPGEGRRFCFASTPLTAQPRLQADADCCRAQARMNRALIDMYEAPSRRSLTSAVHAAVLPLKVFFLLVLLVISILLAIRHTRVEQLYDKWLGKLEVGLFVGSIAVLFFPLMSQAFVQSSETLFGNAGRGVFSEMVPVLSFLFMVWALLIALFFYRRKSGNESFLTVGRLGGLLASNVGMIKYNLVISAFVWAFGVGAGVLGLAMLVSGTVVAILVTLVVLARQ